MKWNKNHLLIGLLVGILLLIIAIPTGEMKTKNDHNTDLEQRLVSILEGMEGVGKVKVMITFTNDETVEGVAIVAEGGGNSVVVCNITEVVEALFSVETHKMKVIRGNLSN